MKLPLVLVPKERKNLSRTLLLCLLLVGVDWLLVPSWQRSPKRGLGLVFGILATLIFLFEMSYPLRRPRGRPLRGAMDWLQAHVYLGLVALIAIVLHQGYSLPHGLMGWLLVLFSLWVTLSGLVGVLLQKWIPVALSQGLTVTALYERIPSLVEGLEDEAEALVEGASERVAEFYRTKVREGLQGLKPSFSFLLDVRGDRDRALEAFRSIAEFVSPEEREKIEALKNIYTDKLELDAHYSLQRILRRWSLWTLHVPAAGILLGLVAIHILSWAIY